MNNKEKEQWLREAYKYTRDFDFRRLDKYKEANEDLHIDDLVLDYTMLYEFYKERTKKLQKENKQLRIHLNAMKQYSNDMQDRMGKVIKVLKLCNSECSKEVIDILRGDKN